MLKSLVIITAFVNAFLGGASAGVAIKENAPEFAALAAIAFSAVYLSISVYNDLNRGEQHEQ